MEKGLVASQYKLLEIDKEIAALMAQRPKLPLVESHPSARNPKEDPVLVKIDFLKNKRYWIDRKVRRDTVRVSEITTSLIELKHMLQEERRNQRCWMIKGNWLREQLSTEERFEYWLLEQRELLNVNRVCKAASNHGRVARTA